jgi:hypothetical protein
MRLEKRLKTLVSPCEHQAFPLTTYFGSPLLDSCPPLLFFPLPRRFPESLFFATND